jgi:anthranilate phosphoribosyltransferase
MAEVALILDKLYGQQTLTQAEAFSIFSSVMRGDVSAIRLASILTALKIKGESPNEIAGAAGAMIANARPFPTPDYAFADIVGTGGDGHNTINISSAAALVAAACGAKVAKHGNRSVSSKSGSADLFRAFGIHLEVTPDTARQCLDETNFCFLFAPVYHAGMRYAAPVRAELKTRTLFNILGPLANPAGPTHGVFGVYSAELLEPYANTLNLLGQQQAFIVHGAGLDELALHGESQIIELLHGETHRFTVTPQDFGLASYPLEAIKGGTPEENQTLIAAALAGEGKPAHMAAIAMNAAALLKNIGLVSSFKEGAELAMNAMAESKPLDIVNKVATLSQQDKP